MNPDPDFDVDVTEPQPRMASSSGPHRPTPSDVQKTLELYQREAKALGNVPAAARLYHEIGLLLEGELKNPRSAAECFQKAYRLNPKSVSNLRAARRLFSEVGNWQMVAQLLEAEIAAVSSEAEKIALSLERASILEQRLGKVAEAQDLLRQCKQRAPDDVAVLSELELSSRASGSSQELAAAFAKHAQAVTDPGLKCHYLCSAARLHETALAQPREAASLYRKAIGIGSFDVALLSDRNRSSESDGQGDDRVAALQTEAASAGSAAAPIYHRISRIYERQGKAEEALRALLAARRIAPHDPLILDELASRFEASGHWAELAEVLQTRAQRIADPNERTMLNLRLGALYEDRLGKEEKALRCYRAVLEQSRSHPVAVTRLGKLYARRQQWTELLEVYAIEIAGSADPRQKAGRLYKCAEVLETRLGRDEEAIAQYKECLHLQPGDLAAEKALIRLYERHQCWDDLLGLFEQDLTRTSDRDQVMAILSRMAEVYEERKLDSRKAVETLRRILEVAPDHLATLRNLARVCERAGFWDELIRVHELEASLVGDAKQVISLVHRVAEIYDEQLHQKEQAIAAYQKLLTLAPTYLPALKGLGRLYAQAGRWAELVDMYRQEAEITAAPDQAAGLLFNAGELLEERLEKLDEAIAVYHEALTLAPTYVPALRALARIHRSQKSWESLVEVLRAEAAARGDSAERANTLFQVAALWEDELRRADLAIETNLEVLALVPDHVPALRALERLFAAQRQLDGGVAYEARLDLLLRLGELLEWRLGEEEQALACYRQVLALEAGHLPALCAARRVLTHQGEHREAFKLAMAAGNALRDPSSAVEMLLEASALALEKLKDRAAACDAYQAVLARDPLQARAAKKLKELMSGADSPRRAPRPRKPARK